MASNPEDELIAARDSLLRFAQDYDSAPETATLNQLWQHAKELGKSSSGSWLGYHANVYYKNFVVPPAEAHFNVEFGTGYPNWIEHTAHDVIDYIVDASSKAALAKAEQLAERGLALLNSVKMDVLSLLTVFLSNHDDTFVRRIADEIDQAKVLDSFDIANEMSPKRQVITRDLRAAQQGTLVPPHVQVQARITAAHQPAAHCHQLAEKLDKLAAHLFRVKKLDDRAARIGTNVFIGHGRSQVWRDLKDFVKDRLRLPYDEFNSVPVAGITNIARLSEMLDVAACAFIIMTAEDELADGTQQARMNVIHEVGLFQVSRTIGLYQGHRPPRRRLPRVQQHPRPRSDPFSKRKHFR